MGPCETTRQITTSTPNNPHLWVYRNMQENNIFSVPFSTRYYYSDNGKDVVQQKVILRLVRDPQCRAWFR